MLRPGLISCLGLIGSGSALTPTTTSSRRGSMPGTVAAMAAEPRGGQHDGGTAEAAQRLADVAAGGVDIVVSAQPARIFGFGGPPGDHDGLEAHRPGELHTEVTQTADTEHPSRSPGSALVWRSALYVVTPAQHIVAASTSESSDGIRASALAGTVTDPHSPPGYCQPGSFMLSQWMKVPLRQGPHPLQCPPNQPTATRSPITKSSTPPPSSTILPAISCPGVNGHRVFGKRR